ncbi:hypothetical protein GQ44DRAFT_191031 [Phaeosphaeriaceae sp. PMI808]|nr:hypothetical protein GQ44DRAFT_191031 [Phaeosphaeriaceae sp. PMI808]
MGKSEEDAVVDNKFRVFGVQGLRVVHLSVLPFVINAHTQNVAYVVGEVEADVLAESMGLGRYVLVESLR